MRTQLDNLACLDDSLSGLQEKLDLGAQVCLELASEVEGTLRKQQHLNQLTATTAYLAEVDMEVDMMKQALDFIMTSTIPGAEEGGKGVDLVRAYQNKLEELNNLPATSLHRFVESFRPYTTPAPAAENGAQGMEVDLLLADVHVSTTCPLTQQQLKSPVKNPRCGHVYSRQAILQHIRAKKASAQCPASGCVAQVVSVELSKDSDMEARLRRENRARKSGGRENVMVYKKKH